MKDLKITKALKYQSATLRGDLDIVLFRQLPDNFANHLLDRLSHRLLDNTPRYGYHELMEEQNRIKNESRAIPTDN
jgi:hypothetical protein